MKPFDLEAAKRGEPLQDGDGNPVKFIAHVPEATKIYRVLVLDQCGAVDAYTEAGEVVCGGKKRLFMAPKKVTLYSFVYKVGPKGFWEIGGIFYTPEARDRAAAVTNWSAFRPVQFHVEE